MNIQHFDNAASNWDSFEYRVERARSIAQLIQVASPISAQTRVLDFGCGTGLLGFNYAPIAHTVTFADTSPGMLAQVEQKATILGYANTQTLLLDDSTLQGQYDLIVTLMTLHHIPNYRSSIQQLCRILDKTGKIFLCDLDTEDGSFHGESKVPHNGFSRTELEQILVHEGLYNVKSQTGHVAHKMIEGKRHDYPIFIISGSRNP